LEQTRESKPERGIWILAGSAAVVAFLVLRSARVALRPLPGFSTRKKAEADILAIDSALQEYAIANGGKYPDSLEALVTPDANDKSFLDQPHIPKDAWGNEYIYERPGPGNPRPIVQSYGKDGRPGGAGGDADIDNLTLRKAAHR
jgi:general secretion pathway protein G